MTEVLEEAQSALKHEVLKVDIRTLPKTSFTPILDYCRKLVSKGIEPDCKLEVYRNGDLALTVHNIGKAAKYTVGSNSSGTPVFKIDSKQSREPVE